MLKASLACLSAFVLGQTVLAKPVAAQVDCDQPQNTSEANACLQQADQGLNRTYQSLMSTLSAPNRQKLIEAEKLWIKFRDAHCAFSIRNSGLNTSMGRQFYFSCLGKLTRERTLQLQQELEK